MRTWYILILLVLQAGCQIQPSNNDSYFDLTQQDKISVFSLSEICDSISYIPLETLPESMLKAHNMKIIFTQNGIFINDSHIALYKFSTKGKYLNKLANQGRGPQEFMQIMDFDINRKTSELFVYDNVLRKIEVFDTAFNPIRTLKPVPYNMCQIMANKDNHIVCCAIRDDYRAQGKVQNSLIILDPTDGHQIFTRESLIPSIKPKERSNFIFSSDLTKYQDRIYYKEYRSDTYYCLQDSSTLDSMVYRIYIGPTHPAELDYDWEKHEQINNYSRLGGAMETLRYIIIHFFPKNEDVRLACYDKKRQKLTIFPEKKFPVNDIDQGWSPKCFRKINDTTLVEIIPAIKFKDIYKNNDKFPISEEDNPVLMLIHLKK